MRILKHIKKLISSMIMEEYKQVLLVRSDLKLPKGKMSAQCAHAAVEAVLKASASDVKSWRKEGQKKVVLKVDNEKELYRYIQQAKDTGLTTSTITDAGKTVIAPGTVTCGAIGPGKEDEIDRIISHLKLI